MKRLLFSGVFLLLLSSPAQAQRIKLYRSVIYTAQGKPIDGILYDMTDSTVRYAPNDAPAIRQIRAGQQPVVTDVHRDTIERIVIRRKGHFGRGLLIGGGIGAGLGLTFAVLTPSSGGLDNLARVAGGIATSFLGLLTGAFSGSIPYRNRLIHQDKGAFGVAKTDLKWLSVRAQQRVRSTTPADTLLK